MERVAALEVQRSSGLLAGNDAAAFRLTGADLDEMARIMRAESLDQTTFVKQAGRLVERYVPARAGAGELNTVRGVGYLAKAGTRPQMISAVYYFDREALTVFDDAVRLDADYVGVSSMEYRVRAVLHELTHEMRGYAGSVDPMDETVAFEEFVANSWGFPVPIR